ncbi:MAG: PTS fructose transporter subunit IIA [Nocardioides sp.]|nr:PTS fructose transporter subunit IIA [Nocardioides sp.]
MTEFTGDLITPALVDLHLDAANDGAPVDKVAAIRALACRAVEAGRAGDLEQLVLDLKVREEQLPTGLEGGIGVPHARSATVTEPTLVFGRSDAGVPFGAEDGPAHLVFLIAVPDEEGDCHLAILAALARRLVQSSFKDALLAALEPEAVVDLVRREVVRG